MPENDRDNILPHERLVQLYFKRLSQKTNKAEDDYYRLNDREIRKIKILERNAILYAALAGTLGVLSLYIPSYLFHSFFYSFTLQIPIPYSTATFPFPVVFTIYGVLLAITEIFVLMFINIYTVHKLAFTCGFPNQKDVRYEEHLNALFNVGLEKPNKNLLKLGIDPFAGMSKYYLFFFTTLVTLKATLSNAIMKILLGRILGRFALRYAIDMISIPIFAFWNAYATQKVVREARLRILSPDLIELFTRQIYNQHQNDQDFKNTLYDALQFLAIVKRDFHHNHYLLAENIIEKFSITIQQQKVVEEDELLEKIQNLQPGSRESFMKLLVLGIIIDGKLSFRERKVIQLLSEKKLILVDYTKIEKWSKDFIEGRGLQEMFDSKLITY